MYFTLLGREWHERQRRLHADRGPHPFRGGHSPLAPLLPSSSKGVLQRPHGASSPGRNTTRKLFKSSVEIKETLMRVASTIIWQVKSLSAGGEIIKILLKGIGTLWVTTCVTTLAPVMCFP